MENKGWFKRGHKTNVGRIVSKQTRLKISAKNKGHVYRGTGWKHGETTKAKCREAKIAEKNPQWKGDEASYGAIHKWLKRNHEDTPCEECGNEKAEWALKHGERHGHYRSKYRRLCRKHHAEYDITGSKRTPEQRARISEGKRLSWQKKKNS